MSQSVMTWIIVALLILIIILLAICIFLDVRLSYPDSTTKDSTTVDTTTDEPPITTTAPVTSTEAPVTSTETPVTSTETPVTSTETPVTSTETPVTSTETPVTSTEAPVTTTEAPVTSTEAPESTEKPFDPTAPTICIDPGHGFTDPGAIGKLNGENVYESDINLAISLKLKAYLEDMGYNVILTHDGVTLPENKYLSPSSPIYNVNNRNQFITDRKDVIDLVVSVHCNASTTSSASGSGYYILRDYDTGYNARSKILMSYIISAVRKALSLPKDPTYYYQELMVLKTGLPSVLVECGFITNANDVKNLCNNTWQQKYAKALADGIANYCDKYL